MSGFRWTTRNWFLSVTLTAILLCFYFLKPLESKNSGFFERTYDKIQRQVVNGREFHTIDDRLRLGNVSIPVTFHPVDAVVGKETVVAFIPVANVGLDDSVMLIPVVFTDNSIVFTKRVDVMYAKKL